MQQWEYCYIDLFKGEISPAQWVEAQINGFDKHIATAETDDKILGVIVRIRVAAPNRESAFAPSLEYALCALGLDGWELVTHAQTFAGGSQMLILKRPLPANSTTQNAVQ